MRGGLYGWEGDVWEDKRSKPKNGFKGLKKIGFNFYWVSFDQTSLYKWEKNCYPICIIVLLALQLLKTSTKPIFIITFKFQLNQLFLVDWNKLQKNT